ncbi:LysR family transcriptional regulator [Parasalinivibrio latis]|uniref:LysR family transcriptional regulator n=1 Tax=Parasalinivibrio latis TaxID=2952610 RepID=UPI0030E046A3
MNIHSLLKIDLNLLVCLHVLLDECHVSRTAERLHLSQSAISKNLAKLRDIFEDPLFTRAAHGIKPTPKALLLAPKLREALGHLEQLTRPDIFSPQNSKRQFRLSLVESTYPLLLPQFVGELFEQAPGITVSAEPWQANTFSEMTRGVIDLGITGKDLSPEDASLTMMPPEDIHSVKLYLDNQVVLMRAGHPLLKADWTEQTYLSARHVQVRCAGSDRWLLDYKLADNGLQRDIAMYVPDFNGAASLCTCTDLLFTAPKHFAEYIAPRLNLVVLPLPIPLPPMAYTLFWHRQNDDDPGHTWLRQLIISRCNALTAEK